MMRKYVYYTIVVIALAAYLWSLSSPLVTIKKLLILSDTISLLSALSSLMQSGELFLFFIVLIFTIILPLLKFGLLIMYGINPEIEQKHNKIYICLDQLSKWAMLDVFIAAFLIVVIKLGVLASALTHYGLYLFIFSVLASMLCSKTRSYWFSKNSS